MAATTGTTKKVFWKFDPNNSTMSVDTTTSVNAQLEARFEFKLEVYKDAQTHVESMKITNYKDGNENGSITTSVVDLEKDIKNFKKFGVVIGDTYFRDLAKEIVNNYLDIQVGTVSFAQNDLRLGDLIKQVEEFLAGAKDYITDTWCFVPVNEFNGLASDCGYCDYEMRTLREQLAQNGFIYAEGGRYTKIKRIKNGRPERMVAFHTEKLDVKVPEKKEKKTPVNGDVNE